MPNLSKEEAIHHYHSQGHNTMKPSRRMTRSNRRCGEGGNAARFDDGYTISRSPSHADSQEAILITLAPFSPAIGIEATHPQRRPETCCTASIRTLHDDSRPFCHLRMRADQVRSWMQPVGVIYEPYFSIITVPFHSPSIPSQYSQDLLPSA